MLWGPRLILSLHAKVMTLVVHYHTYSSIHTIQYTYMIHAYTFIPLNQRTDIYSSFAFFPFSLCLLTPLYHHPYFFTHTPMPMTIFLLKLHLIPFFSSHSASHPSYFINTICLNPTKSCLKHHLLLFLCSFSSCCTWLSFYAFQVCILEF